MAFDASTFTAGALQLAIALVFAMVAVYLGVWLFDRSTKNLDQIQELRNGNVAIGILLAAIVFSLATVIRTGVEGLTGAVLMLPESANQTQALAAFLAGIIQLLAGLLFAIISIRLALWLFTKVSKGIDADEALKSNNIAVAILVAGILISVASVIAGGASDLAASLGF